MLNQVILVGSLLSDPKLVKLEDGKSKTEIDLVIKRAYKDNETGEYETDTIRCILWSGIAENTVEYCKAGSTVGVKARLAGREVILPNGETLIYPEVIAEKITFINTKKEEY